MFRLKKNYYIDRETGERHLEEVYGEIGLAIVYPSNPLFRLLTAPIRFFLTRFSLFSHLYGRFQSRPASAKKVAPFIKKFHIDTAEFQKQSFTSFNDFFIRKIKPRQLSDSPLIIPADGRYRFFPNTHEAEGHYVKGQKFTIEALLQSKALAEKYAQGAMCIARLCPTDYHRFHFPCAGTPSNPTLIDGHLYSVNPVPLSQNIHIFSHNKRMVTTLQTDTFGDILIVEVGATCVGTIHQTYTPDQSVQKGDEKGYFSFGGSAMVLLFEPGRVTFAPDLLTHTDEIRCLMGQSLV